MTDAPIYRVGPQPGGQLSGPDMLNSREGPQAKEPSKCLSERSCRERLAKGAFYKLLHAFYKGASYKRLEK